MNDEAPRQALEQRLTAAYADTARRLVPDSLSAPGLPGGRVAPDYRPPAPTGLLAWRVPVIAAAAVVALTIAGIVLAGTASQRPHSAATGPTSTVLSYRADSAITSSVLQAAADIFRSRLTDLGVDHPDVHLVGTSEISVSIPSGLSVDPTQLGATGMLEFRPTILDPIPAQRQQNPPAATPATPVAGPTRATDPWKTLGFPPPDNGAAYDALTPSQKAAVRTAMDRWDCTTRPTAQDEPALPIIACSQDLTAKYLLGPAIISGHDIESASVAPANLHPSLLTTSVNVSLAPAGRERWAEYTAQHNATLHPGDTANVVGFVLDESVIQAPIVSATITGANELQGNFNQTTARTLAATLTAGPLPATFNLTTRTHT